MNLLNEVIKFASDILQTLETVLKGSVSDFYSSW